MREGWWNPGVCKRHTTPKATLSAKVVWGVARNGESSGKLRGRQRERGKYQVLESPDGPAPDGGPAGISRVRHPENGAGNGIRTRDFDLGKVALYH